MLSRGMQGALSAMALSVALVGAVPLLVDDRDRLGWTAWPLLVAVAAFWLSVLAVLLLAVRDVRLSRVPVAATIAGKSAGSPDLSAGAGR